MTSRVVVVGGAGYIGAHVVRALLERGREVEIVDDLSTGRRSRNPGVPHHTIDVAADPRARERLGEVLAGAGTVVMLVALKDAAQSVREPLAYYRTNVDAVRTVVEAAGDAGVPRLLYSSSASVYGAADGTVGEDAPTDPVSPYGRSKLVGEWLVDDGGRALGLTCASLRYFNVAGAVSADLADDASSSLVPAAVQAVRAGRAVGVFGTDYPTRDGSAVRDYVHVLDVAQAHVAVTEHLEATGRPGHEIFNVGTGRGSTVLEVVDALRAVAGEPVRVEHRPRRAGDMAESVARTSRIAEVTGWRARHDIAATVASAWMHQPQP